MPNVGTGVPRKRRYFWMRSGRVDSIGEQVMVGSGVRLGGWLWASMW
jgi:hypothetical protein